MDMIEKTPEKAGTTALERMRVSRVIVEWMDVRHFFSLHGA